MDAAWQSIYTAAMAFTNTGFLPTSEGLAPYAHDVWFLVVLMIGVIFGAIGFPVIYALRRNLRHPQRWSLHVKLTLVTFGLLLVGGAARLLRASSSTTRARWPTIDVGQRILQSFFISSMARSGGFSTLDIGQLDGSSLLVTDMLMFIGGGSASTAGGIKVTTLAILFLAAFAEARGIDDMEAYERRIPQDVLRLGGERRAVGGDHRRGARASLLLLITDEPLDYVLFDVISAFATCGLSTGFTQSTAGCRAVRARRDHVLRSHRYRDPRRRTRGDDTAPAVPPTGREAHRWLTRSPTTHRCSSSDSAGSAPPPPASSQRLDRDVLAVDEDVTLVQKWSERVTHAVQADARSIDALRQIGAQDFAIAVVAVGSSIEASVLITANLVDLKIPQIWAKAISQSHGKILSRIGANHVIYPEAEAGERVAHLVSGRMLDFIEFDDDFAIVKMYPPKPIRGISLGESQVRKKYGITVVGVKSPGKDFTYATPETVISEPRPDHRERAHRRPRAVRDPAMTLSAARRSPIRRRSPVPGQGGRRRPVEHRAEVGLLQHGDRALGRALRARDPTAQLGRVDIRGREQFGRAAEGLLHHESGLRAREAEASSAAVSSSMRKNT